MKNLLSLIIFSLLLSSCEWGVFNDFNASCKLKTVGYKNYIFNIEGEWTEANFGGKTPTQYVSSAHFSPFVIFVHKSDTKIFESGTRASSGLEILAETGKTDITSLYDNNDKIGCVVVGKGLPTGGSTQNITVPVNNTYNTVTVLSMIAPTSDWFVARTINLAKGDNILNGFPLLLLNSSFKESGTAHMLNYDAGTEQDTNAFSLDNDAETVQQNIRRLGMPFSINDVLVRLRYELDTP